MSTTGKYTRRTFITISSGRLRVAASGGARCDRIKKHMQRASMEIVRARWTTNDIYTSTASVQWQPTPVASCVMMRPRHAISNHTRHTFDRDWERGCIFKRSQKDETVNVIITNAKLRSNVPKRDSNETLCLYRLQKQY